MGKFPCDGQGGRHDGRVRGLYPTVLVDGTKYSRYMRMCPHCLTELVGRHRKEWQPRNLFDDSTDWTCCTCCGELAENPAGLRPFFVTMYVNGDQRVDYHAAYCDGCADMIRQEFSLEVQNARK